MYIVCYTVMEIMRSNVYIKAVCMPSKLLLHFCALVYAISAPPLLIPSLRAQFSAEESDHNPLHGSATEDEAEKEIQYFFPKEKTLAVIKPNAIQERGIIWVPILHGGRFLGFHVGYWKRFLCCLGTQLLG